MKASQSQAVIQGFKKQYEADPNFAIFGALADERLAELATPSVTVALPMTAQVTTISELDLPPLDALSGEMYIPGPRTPVVTASPAAPVQVAALPPRGVPASPPVVTEIVPPAENVLVPTEPSPELVSAIQQQLRRLGCYAGNDDGKWGRKAHAALQAFANKQTEPFVLTELDEELLDRLSAAPDLVCSPPKQAEPQPDAGTSAQQPKSAPLVRRKPTKAVVRQPDKPAPVRQRAVVRKQPAPAKLQAQPPKRAKPTAKSAEKSSTKKGCRMIFVGIAIIRKCS